MALALIVLWMWVGAWLLARTTVRGHHRTRRRRPRTPTASGITSRPVRNRPKPPRIRRELIRLKAWSPELGCRTLAEVFNRQFAERQVSVGKTYVAKVLRHSRAEILRLRRSRKHQIPRPTPINGTWALDLTGKADLSGRQQIILGLLDHGARACLRLQALADKRSLTILRELIAAFRRFGLPGCIRVDNEACFNARLMKAALALLGVRLQTIQRHCPRQNGRIERFFGTLKHHLDRIAVFDRDDLRSKLIEFRA